jgi:hypothetical protein
MWLSSAQTLGAAAPSFDTLQFPATIIGAALSSNLLQLPAPTVGAAPFVCAQHL